jgi:CelD/BcsL family acetyltransferase involved in cellulose biosynthesis
MRRKGFAGKFFSDGYERFHSLLSRTFFEKGWLFAADLKLEGKMVACRYGFLYDNKIYDYQTGFDPRYNKYGVMQALISYIIELAIKEKVREFDFLAGEDEYKRRFANSHRKVFSLRAINNTPAGRIYEKLHRIRGALIKGK